MDPYLSRLQQVLEEATAGVTAADLTRGPEGKWTPAQILEHLYLTYKSTSRGIEKCLEQGSPLITAATFKQKVGAFVVLTLECIPSGRKAPERAQPKGMPAEEVVHTIFPEISSLDAHLSQLEHKFGTKQKVLDHPLLGPLNVNEWRKFHFLHARHHARQIRERLVRSPASVPAGARP